MKSNYKFDYFCTPFSKKKNFNRYMHKLYLKCIYCLYIIGMISENRKETNSLTVMQSKGTPRNLTKIAKKCKRRKKTLT